MARSRQRRPSAYALARALARRLAREHPDLLPALTPVLQRLQPCYAGAGFVCVRWHGAAYTFTPTQARVVGLLWRAWRRGVPDLHQALLLEKSDSESARLVDVFKDHACWGTMVVAGSVRGTFRLAGPA